MCQKFLIISAFSFCIAGCVESYLPEVVENNPKLLVVDGSVDADGDARISLMYTTNVTSEERPQRSSGATVEILSENGSTQTLEEIDSGDYVSSNLFFENDVRYRLFIRTSEGDEYLSDYVEVLRTPPIDSLNYIINSQGLDIRVSTHSDNSSTSRYYRWYYTETWEYHTAYRSQYRLVDGEPVYKPIEEHTYTCYRSLPSYYIITGTSEKLGQNIIINQKVATFAPGDPKLAIRYRIDVHQESISEQQYSYMLSLQKSTENVGGLFDPLPSQTDGNIICVSNPQKKAIGNFGISTIEQKSLMLRRSQLGPFGSINTPFCELDTILMGEEETNEHVIDLIYAMGPAPIGYTVSDIVCVDCRRLGGVITKPQGWE